MSMIRFHDLGCSSATRPAPPLLASRPPRAARNLRATALAALLGFASATAASTQALPHVSGTVSVAPATGYLRGDVCVSGFPPGDTLHLVLNHALSILAVDGADPVVLDARLEPGGATRVYSLARPATGDPRRPDACFRYEGTEAVYPVDAGRFRATDESSLLAFDGSSLRARGPARWLPTPFDHTLGLPAERMTFDLEVDCSGCLTLYMSGSPPAPGPSAVFRSAAPREPYLVAGELAVARVGSSWILGGEPAAAAPLLERLARIEDFYSAFLGVPFGPGPDLVFLRPVREPRRGQLWGFFSDPALTLLGMDPTQLLAALGDPRDRVRLAVLGFLAHELAHRYFGWTLGARSPHRDLFGEPFATYLELKALRHFAGDLAYRAALRRLALSLQDSPDLPPIDHAGADPFRFDAYRYAYAPLLLFSLESLIGEPAMTEVLRTLLALPDDLRARADFDLLLSIALNASDRQPDELRDWRRRCLDPRRLATRCAPAAQP